MAASDTPAHVYTDSEGDGHVDGYHAGFLAQVLHFVNIGEVPVMIVLSVLTLGMWLFSLMANH